jgi:hypothetical protein
MKKTITLFYACFLFLASQAQITLTQSDMALPLTQYIRYTDTLPTSLTPGPAGTNQTWIFTGLADHSTDTILFTRPEWTSYGTSFPASNLCMMTMAAETSYMYMNINSDSLNVVGQAGRFAGSASDILVAFNPSQKITDLPTTYLDGFTNTSSFTLVQYYGQSNVDSIKVKDITVTESEFDAWGSITTVLGTYDALRAKVVQVSTDSVWALMFGNWIDMTSSYGGIDTAKRYGWWTNGLGYMILEMDVDPVTDSILDVKYIAEPPQPGGLHPYVKNDVITVYPNPASGIVYISTPENAFMFEVYNTSGQLMKSAKANTSVSPIDISGLPSGVYIIRISAYNGFTICHKNLIVE